MHGNTLEMELWSF